MFNNILSIKPGGWHRKWATLFICYGCKNKSKTVLETLSHRFILNPLCWSTERTPKMCHCHGTFWLHCTAITNKPLHPQWEKRYICLCVKKQDSQERKSRGTERRWSWQQYNTFGCGFLSRTSSHWSLKHTQGLYVSFVSVCMWSCAHARRMTTEWEKCVHSHAV